MKKCAFFSDNKVCIHSKVSVSDFDNSWVGIMEVIAIAKDRTPFETKDILYGYMIKEDGKKKAG